MHSRLGKGTGGEMSNKTRRLKVVEILSDITISQHRINDLKAKLNRLRNTCPHTDVTETPRATAECDGYSTLQYLRGDIMTTYPALDAWDSLPECIKKVVPE